MFEIYLQDTKSNTYAQLDCENIDFSTVFAVADVYDLSKRKAVITRNLDLKGTIKNNKAFGSAYMMNKYVDTTNAAMIGFNFNPQTLVPCLIYENGVLLLKGKLRLVEIKYSADGSIIYSTVVTSDAVEFFQQIADLELRDLDLSSYSHTFNVSTITSSWDYTSDYVYPVIHYGQPFRANVSEFANPFSIQNFRPAIKLKSILSKIFNETDYNYLVKGDYQFQKLFDSLIIPNSDEKLLRLIKYESGLRPLSVKSVVSSTNSNADSRGVVDPNEMYLHVALDNITDHYDLVAAASAYHVTNTQSLLRPNRVFNITREFTAAASLPYTINYKNLNAAPKQITMSIQLLERDVINPDDASNYNNTLNWTVVAEESTVLEYGSSLSKSGTINVAERAYPIGKQLTVRIKFRLDNGNHDSEFHQSMFNFSVYECEFGAPASVNQSIEMAVNVGESITPTLPADIKIVDFLQSIRNLFNLYIYQDGLSNTMVFERYDDYYAKTKGLNLAANAVDWTSKIDLAAPMTVKSNLDIPKNYDFKFKTDNDFISDYYKKKYENTYGDYSITDSKGITDKKEISVIFSPTPLVSVAPSVNGSATLSFPTPYIYKDNSGTIAPVKSNIRILSFSGMVNERLTVIEEGYSGTNWFTRIGSHKYSIPRVSNYFIENGVPVYDLHFGRPKEIFFPQSSSYLNVKNSYSNYMNQIKELVNPNVTYLTCEAFLNEIDINNLELSQPVYIDFGEFGNSYWKVLKVDYKNNSTTSTIELQKIIQ